MNDDLLRALAIMLCHYGRDLDIEEPESFKTIDGILREHTGVGIWETQKLGFDAIVKATPKEPVTLLHAEYEPNRKEWAKAASEADAVFAAFHFLKTVCATCGKPNCKPQNHAGWNPNDEGHG